MEFQAIFDELVSGKILRLRFSSDLEYQAFKNSYAVYHHRQVKRFRLCGMADEFKQYTLTFQFKDSVLSLQYAPKERRKYDFTIIEDDSSNEAGS